MNQIILLAKAWNFAAQKHAAQRRKGMAQEPYVNHLAEVAELVALATDGTDANLVAAAVLHDTIEDTETTAGELAQGFNEDICRLVLEVTDDKSLAYQVRKDRQVITAATKSDRQGPQARGQDSEPSFAGEEPACRLGCSSAPSVP